MGYFGLTKVVIFMRKVFPPGRKTFSFTIFGKTTLTGAL
jgi:hypothetical protein